MGLKEKIDKIFRFCNEIRLGPESGLKTFESMHPEIQKEILLQSFLIARFPKTKSPTQKGLVFSILSILPKLDPRNYPDLEEFSLMVKDPTFKRRLKSFKKFFNQLDKTAIDFSADEILKDKKQKKTSKKSRRRFQKEGQTREKPPDDDPVTLYYTSLYAEKPSSALAITWLTKHGFLEGL